MPKPGPRVAVANATDPLPAVHRRGRPWQVLHACEDASELIGVVDAQLAVGMRPYLVTPNGVVRRQTVHESPRKTSLLQAWGQVRNWRKQLDEAASSQAVEVVHAHCFSAGMASVRGRFASVCDMRGFVEDIAAAAGQTGERSWLGRSFRAAEQFVMANAGAIIVHSSMMRKACMERGAPAAEIFVIPDPIAMPPPSFSDYYQQDFALGQDVLKVFASESAEGAVLVEAFASLLNEVPGARLFVPTDDRGVSSALHYHAQQRDIDEAVFVISKADEEAALASADIVIAGPGPAAGSARERLLELQPNAVAMAALARARPLLAADVPSNREVSPEGRGCLWFKPGDARDLSHRASFLARNPEFRRTLAENGCQHLMVARDPEKVGQMYDDAYRHAFERHQRGSSPQSASGTLLPAVSAL